MPAHPAPSSTRASRAAARAMRAPSPANPVVPAVASPSQSTSVSSPPPPYSSASSRSPSPSESSVVADATCLRDSLLFFGPFPQHDGGGEGFIKSKVLFADQTLPPVTDVFDEATHIVIDAAETELNASLVARAGKPVKGREDEGATQMIVSLAWVTMSILQEIKLPKDDYSHPNFVRPACQGRHPFPAPPARRPTPYVPVPPCTFCDDVSASALYTVVPYVSAKEFDDKVDPDSLPLKPTCIACHDIWDEQIHQYFHEDDALNYLHSATVWTAIEGTQMKHRRDEAAKKGARWLARAAYDAKVAKAKAARDGEGLRGQAPGGGGSSGVGDGKGKGKGREVQ